MQKLPLILDEFMREKRLTGPKAAELLDVSTGCLYLWLNGTHVPPRRNARRLAVVLGRPGLVKVIDADRVAHRRKIAAGRRRAGVA